MLDFLKRIKNVEIKNTNQDEYDVKSIGNIVIPEKLTDRNAFTLANSVAELFFPIDFYADRDLRLAVWLFCPGLIPLNEILFLPHSICESVSLTEF